jgi:Putative Flp pilus-assembly TadE/G-like
MSIVKLRFFENMRSQSKHNQSGQRGYVIVMLAISLGVLLSLAALAIDTGRLYQQHTQIQRFARQAANAVLGLRAQRGWWWVYGGDPKFTGTTLKTPEDAYSTTNHIMSLKIRAYRVFAENMKAAGMDPANLDLPSLSGCGLESITDDANPPPGCSVNGIDYDVVTDTVTVNVRYQAPTFLAARVPLLKLEADNCQARRGHCTMNVRVNAQLQPALIVMILDASGSMRCDWNSANPEQCGVATNGNRKIDKLIEASRAFWEHNNPIQTRMAVLPFNLVAAPDAGRVNFPAASGADFGFGATPARWAAWKNFFLDPVDTTSSLFPRSNTNHADALWEARNMLQAVGATPGLDVPSGERFVVFFTDGAPTAGRFRFEALNNTAMSQAFDTVLGPGHGFNPAGAQFNDFFLYSVQWNPGGGASPYEGPGPLIHNTATDGMNAREELFQYEIGDTLNNIFPVDNSVSPPVPSVVPCVADAYLPPTANWVSAGLSFYGSPNNFRSILSHCFQAGGHFGFLMPGATDWPSPPTTTNINSREILVDDPNHYDTSGTIHNSYFRQLFYHSALEAAQQLRNTGDTTIFGVGLGPALPLEAYQDENAGPPRRSEPYFDHRNQWVRKDALLRALVRDEEASGDPSFWYPDTETRITNTITPRNTITNPNAPPATRTNPHSARGQRISLGFKRANSLRSGARNGSYYATNKADELTDVFTEIAKQIMLRMGA